MGAKRRDSNKVNASVVKTFSAPNLSCCPLLRDTLQKYISALPAVSVVGSAAGSAGGRLRSRRRENFAVSVIPATLQPGSCISFLEQLQYPVCRFSGLVSSHQTPQGRPISSKTLAPAEQSPLLRIWLSARWDPPPPASFLSLNYTNSFPLFS